MKAICEKYGLVFGDASYYKGDVPEKNIKEMEDFKLRDDDKEKRTNVDDYYAMAQRQMMFGQMQINLSSFQGRPNELKEYFIQRSFKICAPEKDFDMTYYTKKGYKLEYDPIVLQPVAFGYLIVTKWGLEASDQLTVNENHN